MSASDDRETIRVLLVEDDEDDVVLTRDLLAEAAGAAFELDWAADGRSGLDRLCDGGYDACLLDYNLGAQTGLEVLRHASVRGCTTPVILLTGRSDGGTDIEAMRAGAYDYLVKGQINAALLERAIRYAIEKRRAYDERVRRAREETARVEAEAANRAKDDFIATVSHELRTPLAAVVSAVKMLQSGKLDAQKTEFVLGVIDRNTRAQAKLVEDLLDVSRVATGTLRIDPAPTDLTATVEAAIEGVRHAIDEKGLVLETGFEPGDVRISGDAARLQQIVWNLVSNAVKFTPKGGRVAVRLGREGGAARLVVADTGQGIAAALLPAVFERFRQGDGTRASRGAGLGLGLAITRHLVELHGGTIEAESEGEGRGATFTVRVPLLDAG
jgi:signal transduction histidine kinase